MSQEIKVGALVLAALLVAAVGIFFIGEQSRLFANKNDYFMRVRSVGGLNTANPVRLNGVVVGQVTGITLPPDVDKERLTVYLSVEERYAGRIREDSEARIRTLGLLGDKYVEITSGSPDAPIIPPGGRIPTAEQTDVDKLITSGEDVVDNTLAISHSARNILDRIDHGEGLIGKLTTDTETSERLTESIDETLSSVRSLTEKIEAGDGVLGRLITDERLGERLASSITSLDRVLQDFEEGEGLAPALLQDEEMKESFRNTLSELQEASEQVDAFTNQLESGDGLLKRLVTDDEYGEEVSRDLERLVDNLGDVAEKLNTGDGTAAKLIDDPQVYRAVQDIIVGVNESKFLRWLIRNRQKKGIEERYEEARPDEGTVSEENGLR